MGIILVMVIFFIAIGINALVAIVTMSISLFRSAGILWYHTIPITIGICFLPSIIRYIRAIFSRLHFSRKFRSYCKKYKIHLKTHHPALLSLFVKYKSLDYSMLIDQKEYTLKFFPGNTLKRVLHFDGLSKSESSKFYTMPVMLHNWYLYAIARKLLKGNMFINKLLYAQKHKQYIFDFNPTTENILLFSPNPMQLFGIVGNQNKPLGSGEKYDSVTLYESDAWLNFLSRSMLKQ